ncbi:hypothetical protein [Alkalihalobacillus sp. TS-13]|uniref:hypothetical protein n=1 Tax=Alkalihalobacillus sp. TS-13 TaxID=2842455 RepID=UPI001C87A65A|nr:hypothetical protein [Alkalihalobacillus sp. TS-13]
MSITALTLLFICIGLLVSGTYQTGHEEMVISLEPFDPFMYFWFAPPLFTPVVLDLLWIQFNPNKKD